MATSLAMIASTGCSEDTTANPTSSAGSPEGALLAAGVAQYREDEITGVVQIELRGTGAEPIVVDRLALRWSGLADAPPATPHYTVFPDVTVALPAPLGTARCQQRQSNPVDPGTATVDVVYTRPDGSHGSTTVPVTSGTNVLERIHVRLCEHQAVADVVQFAFGPTWTATTLPDGTAAVAGALVARRGAGNDEIRVTDVATEGVLLNIRTERDDRQPWLVLAKGEPSAEAAVVITSSNRCDAHALADDKKSLLFSVRLEIGGQPSTAEVRVPPTDAATVRSVIDRTCATG